MAEQYRLIQFHGLISPTYLNGHGQSRPRFEVRQQLETIGFLASLGTLQGIIPFLTCPSVPLLRDLGFSSAEQVLLKDPSIFDLLTQEGGKRTEQLAHFFPSIDCMDHRAHIIPANNALQKTGLNSLEDKVNLLKVLFHDPHYFNLLSPLPMGTIFDDMGAGNCIRLAPQESSRGLYLFAFGNYGLKKNALLPSKSLARQTYEASEALVRGSRLDPKFTMHVKIHPAVFDCGAESVAQASCYHGATLFYHEKAFVDAELLLEEIRRRCQELDLPPASFIEVKEKDLPLQLAIDTGFFESILAATKEGTPLLIISERCLAVPRIQEYIEVMIHDPEHPIAQVHAVPQDRPKAALFNIWVNENEFEHLPQQLIWTKRLHSKLENASLTLYPETFEAKDLLKPESFHLQQEVAKLFHTIR